MRHAFPELHTLQDRLSCRVIHGTKPGPAPYLNKNKEANLSEFLEVGMDEGGGSRHSLYRLSDNGWIDMKLFKQ